VFKIGLNGCSCGRCFAIDTIETLAFSIVLSHRFGVRNHRATLDRFAHTIIDISRHFPGIIPTA